MPGQAVGSMIAAGFGLVYVVVNSGTLPAAVQWPLRSLAVAAAVAVLLAVLRRQTPNRGPGPDRSNRAVFGRAYWCVVIVEAVALFGGVRILAGPLETPQAGVAWVSLVVGVHFFALAVIFAQPFFHVLGAAISLCGVTGLLLALAGVAQPAVELAGGVVPGVILLAFAGWGATRRPQPNDHASPSADARVAGTLRHR